MSAGPMHCMPLIVINMGGEMVYILEQRLTAQSVGNDKSKKVLQDVLRTMYSPKFIRELFKPQEMYSSASTREIFNKLAHSSIMRLNESSMDKLYDLMTMGFKHQLLQCTYPGQMMHVTLNHLNILKQIGDSEAINLLVDAALQLTMETYGDMGVGDWLQLRQGLFTFVQGHKIKVSLFLQNNLQNLDGSFVLAGTYAGHVPMGAHVPGTIKYYDNEGNVDYSTDFVTMAADGCTPFDPDYHTPLGVNLYAKDLGKQINMATLKAPACAAADVARVLALQMKNAPLGAEAQSRGYVRSSSSGSSGGAKRGAAPPGKTASATAELNLLAELMGSAAKSAADEEEESGDARGAAHAIKPFKINLFPDDPFADDGGSGVGEDKGVATVVLDSTSQRKTAAAMMHDLHLDDDTGSKRGAPAKAAAKESGDDDDDLLDLMDDAAK